MKNKFVIIAIVTNLALCPYLTTSLPVTKKDLPNAIEIKFFHKYGYLEPSDPQTEALYKQDAVIQAVRDMQLFGGIPVTGKMDNVTRALMQKPRCGVPDILWHNYTRRQKRYIIATQGWTRKHLTYFLANWTPKLGNRDIVLEELAKAFKVWSEYSPLTFTHKEDIDADIVVAFARGAHGDGYPFDGSGNTLAHAYFPYDFGAYGGDVHFDDDENWTKGSSEGVDFFTVAAHELGHSLGLGHSPDPDSIMFPYYKGYNHYFRLGYDDILAMYDLYVRAQFEDTHLETATDNNDRFNPDVGTDHNDDEKTGNEKTTSSDDIQDLPNTTDDNSENDDGNNDDDKPTESITTPSVEGPSSPQPAPKIPDICDGTYDSLALLRGELFVFKDEYMWRFRERKIMQSGYPTKFRYMFDFPKSISHIDAAYENEKDGLIYFFAGRNVFIFDGMNFVDKWPRTLVDLGIPSYVNQLDAAFVWGKNHKTYFISGSEYWRYNATVQKMDPYYPQGMNRWRGIPYPLDTVLRWKDGNTYFFIRKNFYRFNDKKVHVDEHFPLNAPSYWFGCTEQQHVPLNKHKLHNHHGENFFGRSSQQKKP